MILQLPCLLGENKMWLIKSPAVKKQITLLLADLLCSWRNESTQSAREYLFWVSLGWVNSTSVYWGESWSICLFASRAIKEAVETLSQWISRQHRWAFRELISECRYISSNIFCFIQVDLINIEPLYKRETETAPRRNSSWRAYKQPQSKFKTSAMELPTQRPAEFGLIWKLIVVLQPSK